MCTSPSLLVVKDVAMPDVSTVSVVQTHDCPQTKLGSNKLSHRVKVQRPWRLFGQLSNANTAVPMKRSNGSSRCFTCRLLTVYQSSCTTQRTHYCPLYKRRNHASASSMAGFSIDVPILAGLIAPTSRRFKTLITIMTATN